MISAIYPGSFDPITKGHLDIIKRASKMFDKLYVAVMVNAAKTPTFSPDERCELIGKCVKDIDNVEVIYFSGLLASLAEQKGAKVIVKGLRAMSDFESEFQMALINKRLCKSAETVFLPSSGKYMYLSSSVIRQIANLGGDISDFVPEEILNDVYKKFGRN